MSRADFAAGASASLKKTIDEVMAFLGQQGPQPPDNLRDFLHERLNDLAIKWYRKGFNRGHRESHHQAARGKAPKSLSYDATRMFFKGGKRNVHLKSNHAPTCSSC